jgi:tetratricopeptide (TPR) repeat protein
MRLTFLALPFLLAAAPSESVKSLYNSLDPESVAQHMAFYELYPETEEGEKALRRTWSLLSGGHHSEYGHFSLPQVDIGAIIALVNRESTEPPVELSEEQLSVIETLASHFPNRKLKGSKVWDRKDVLALPTEEVDLARGLLIEQFHGVDKFKEQIRQYEASLDVMALQVAARLPKKATHLDKIREINAFIFQEMQFRFPPHSLYAKDIDLYTFLPSVLDSRQGVCLGVSILYLCIAQRLDLPLEVITPPGHIYVRYNDGEKVINIETTARGINLPNETYLGLNTRSLQQRPLKEVIGMAFFNQASVYWMRGEHERTVSLYEKARPYQPDDLLLQMFLGLNYFFLGREKEGKELLRKLYNHTFDYAVTPETLPADLLDGRVDPEGIKAIFSQVDETRASVLDKQEKLRTILKRYPKFRAGILQLAVTYLQLSRLGEAQEILKQYDAVDGTDPTTCYYLAAISTERLDYRSAWNYLKRAEAITASRGHHPKALQGLKTKLKLTSPEL